MDSTIPSEYSITEKLAKEKELSDIREARIKRFKNQSNNNSNNSVCDISESVLQSKPIVCDTLISPKIDTSCERLRNILNNSISIYLCINKNCINNPDPLTGYCKKCWNITEKLQHLPNKDKLDILEDSVFNSSSTYFMYINNKHILRYLLNNKKKYNNSIRTHKCKIEIENIKRIRESMIDIRKNRGETSEDISESIDKKDMESILDQLFNIPKVNSLS